MASPLGWFRRHQKGMMVVFGMVLMAIFGLGSVAMMINPGQMSNPIANKVVMTWNGGKLKQSQIDNLKIRHFGAARFVMAVDAAARDKKAGNFRSPALRIDWMPDNATPRQLDRALAQRYVMAQSAKQAGIVVSDTMVADYISLVHNLVDFSQTDLEAINRGVNGDLDLVQIRNQLKIELAVKQYQDLLATGVPGALSPTEAAQYYNRLEKTVECAVLPLTVEDYLDQVTGTPSNSELKKLFEEGRYQIADPYRLEPGFKLAKRMRVDYVAANLADFLKLEKGKITEEQVQEEYDRLVKEEDRLVMELVPPTTMGNDAPLPPNGDESGTPDDDSAPVPPNDDDAAPKPPGDDETETTEGENETGGDETGGDETGGDETGGDETGGDETGGDDLSLLVQNTAEQFVSTWQDENQTQDEPENTQNQEGAEGEAQEGTEPQTEDGSEDPEATNESGDDPQMLDEDQEDQSLPDDVVLPGEGDSTQLRDPLDYRPKKLDANLADRIRDSMVRETAVNLMQDSMAKAEADVRDQQFDYDPEDEEGSISLDLKEMADRLKLRSGSTLLLDYNDFVKDESFGARKASVTVRQQFGQPRNITAPFADVVFSNVDAATLFDPSDPMMETGTQTSYLWWPVEIKEVEVLTFADAKEEVIKFWKIQEARKLALADAQRIADEINGNNGKLLVRFTEEGKKAIPTGSFTYYLGGLVKPQGVENPGVEFMDEAFGLEMEQCGAALNETKDFAFVIQKVFEDIRNDEKIADELLETWSKFQTVPPNINNTAGGSIRGMHSDNINSIMEDMGFIWIAE